ncbi:aminobenzoyl-glutamate transporter [Sporanaerobium hydrogeniformans]|uniref:Aminobenzoyl-glutamate transporter n=2 Tax=Sporanaerobium hydrogeniformans TaxID=3072179 RepID=A0AC61D9U2_9FIRM|nr:aminobenzoyl-glutamate transporter [Sporanaerobium hydrogeniformans]
MKKPSIIEKIGKKIPDPVIIFMILYAVTLIITLFLGEMTFSMVAKDGSMITYEIKNMFTAENIRWIFDNALLKNWLSYGGGVLGTILVVMLGVGLAEQSGLLSTLIKKVGIKVSDRFLPFVLVFLGIMSSVATDAGYVILIPLAGILYAGLKKNPLIGMAAAFAGVSAGFSANLLPATPSDIIIGSNAKIFAEAQGIPFLNAAGNPLTPATMHYYFIAVSTIILTFVGGVITIKFVKPRLEKQEYCIPEDMHLDDFTVKPEENKALKWAGLGLIIGLIIVAILGFGPLASYTIETEGVVKEITPFIDNIILMITFLFFMPGLFYGIKVGAFKKSMDVVKAMSTSMSSMGYVIVLTFFSYNFLALLSESQLGTYITYLGATALEKMGLAQYPILLIIGFIITTAIINLFVGGLTSKWMLLGPIFIPMLYQVNSAMTPDIVAAAYRVADSSTNIITPLMSYAGLILVFMRKYKPEYSVGDLIGLMFPYSLGFLAIWSTVLIGFFALGIPLGF